jgi:hypothetical protein
VSRKPQPNPCRRCGKPKKLGRGSGYCARCRQITAKRYAPKPCKACGGSKPAGQGRRLCDECRDLRNWATKTRHKVRLRKRCTRCGGPKGPGRYRHLCDRCRHEDKRRVRLCPRCHAHPVRGPLARLCHECKAAAHDRTRERNRQRNREYRRQHAQSRKTNPNQAGNSRMGLRLRREREGRPLPVLSAEEYTERYGRGYGNATRLPAAPLVPLVEQALKSESEVELAYRAQIADKRVREILDGKDQISLVTADRLCVALGVALSFVYREAA